MTATDVDLARAWVIQEQANLWTDLDHAIRHAYNAVWSMGCSNFAIRICSAARIVGPTPWGDVPWRLLAGGVYETLLRVGRVEPDLPADDAWPALDEQMSDHGGRREWLTTALAATRHAIVTDRDAPAIAGEE